MPSNSRTLLFNNKHYLIQDLQKTDIEGKKKYCVCIRDGGLYHLLYNKAGYIIPKFATIKESKKYVQDWDFLLNTL